MSSPASAPRRREFVAAIARHWPEYVMEAVGLGCFMLSACVFAIVLMHPASLVVQWLPDANVRRVLMGLAMGMTAIALIYSPWGRRSGAHLNPAVTLTFNSLGRVSSLDAAFYAFAQLAGGVLAVGLMSFIAPGALRDAAINFVVTVPGPAGPLAAVVTEFGMSFALMTIVLWVSNSKWTRWTGMCAGATVALFISTLAPFSGMSMNPARTLARIWTGIWIYLSAPPLGMLAAAAIYRQLRGLDGVGCPKLDRLNHHRCIFCGAPHGHAAPLRSR